MVRLQRLVACVSVTLWCVGFGGVAWADAPVEHGWGKALGHELMSPYCPGRALPDCPSPQATDLRMWIVAQDEAGRSKDEVIAQLVDRFGDDLLQQPRARGFGLAAYLIPVVAVLLGASFLVVFFRRQMAANGLPAPVPRLAPVDPDLERMVEEEFRRAKDGA